MRPELFPRLKCEGGKLGSGCPTFEANSIYAVLKSACSFHLKLKGGEKMPQPYEGKTAIASGKNAGRVPLNTVYHRKEGTYKLIDHSLGDKGRIITYNRCKIAENKRNKWRPEEVDAHFYTRKVFDYFLKKHGRKSYDNRCGDMKICVHAPTGFLFDRKMDPLKDAIWDTKLRQVRIPGPDLCTLEVIGHEWTHAVIQSSLENKGLKVAEMVGQLGKGGVLYNDFLSLMESISNVFAVLIDPKCKRLLRQPTDHLKEYENYKVTGEDFWRMIHRNAGIMDKAACLILKGLGRERLGKLYYHTVDKLLYRMVRLKSHRGDKVDSFFKWRDSLLKSLKDLCHKNPAYWRDDYEGDKAIIQNAFAKVGIIGRSTNRP
jgi:Zn-dependent metalloprotease